MLLLLCEFMVYIIFICIYGYLNFTLKSIDMIRSEVFYSDDDDDDDIILLSVRSREDEDMVRLSSINVSELFKYY